MVDKLHRLFTAADGIHAATAFVFEHEADCLAAEPALTVADLGKLALVEDSRYFVVSYDGASLTWRELQTVGARVLQQHDSVSVTGVTPLYCGAYHFVENTLITVPARVILGRTSGASTAILQLVNDSTGTAIATWTTSAAIGIVQLGDSGILIPTTGIYSIRLRAGDASTVAHFAGLDWTLETT